MNLYMPQIITSQDQYVTYFFQSCKIFTLIIFQFQFFEMGADVFYPDNPLRERRLKNLAEQIRTSESNVKKWDKQISILGKKISQRLKKLNGYCKQVTQAINQLHLDLSFKPAGNLLDWIDNYSTDHNLSNNGAVKVSKLVIEVIVFVAGSIAGLGVLASIGISVALQIFFGAIVGAIQRKKLREKTKEALKYRFDYKKNQLRCKQVFRVLTEIQSLLQGFQSVLDKLAPKAEKDPTIMASIIQQLQIVQKIDKVKKTIKSIDDRVVRRALWEMDKSAPFRDMEVEDHYSDLNRSFSRSVKSETQKFIQKDLEQMKRAYIEKMTEASALNYYKQFMTGVEKFSYGKLQANINKSIFALWGIYDAIQSKA